MNSFKYRKSNAPQLPNQSDASNLARDDLSAEATFADRETFEHESEYSFDNNDSPRHAEDEHFVKLVK